MTVQLPDNEADLFALMRKELFSSVIGDVLDAQGFRHQYLPPNIRPLSDDMVIIGRAMTVLEADFLSSRAWMVVPVWRPSLLASCSRRSMT
jgi:hypothetical protein